MAAQIVPFPSKRNHAPKNALDSFEYYVAQVSEALRTNSEGARHLIHLYERDSGEKFWKGPRHA
jgi:hypothetical protein